MGIIIKNGVEYGSGSGSSGGGGSTGGSISLDELFNSQLYDQINLIYDSHNAAVSNPTDWTFFANATIAGSYTVDGKTITINNDDDVYALLDVGFFLPSVSSSEILDANMYVGIFESTPLMSESLWTFIKQGFLLTPHTQNIDPAEWNEVTVFGPLLLKGSNSFAVGGYVPSDKDQQTTLRLTLRLFKPKA